MGPGPGQRVALHSALVGRGTISPSLRMWGWAQRPPLRWPVGARAPCVSPSPRSQPHHQGRSSRSMSSSISWAIPGVCQCFTDLEARRAGAAFRVAPVQCKGSPCSHWGQGQQAGSSAQTETPERNGFGRETRGEVRSLERPSDTGGNRRPHTCPGREAGCEVPGGDTKLPLRLPSGLRASRKCGLTESRVASPHVEGVPSMEPIAKTVFVCCWLPWL